MTQMLNLARSLRLDAHALRLVTHRRLGHVQAIGPITRRLEHAVESLVCDLAEAADLDSLAALCNSAANPLKRARLEASARYPRTFVPAAFAPSGARGTVR